MTGTIRIEQISVKGMSFKDMQAIIKLKRRYAVAKDENRPAIEEQAVKIWLKYHNPETEEIEEKLAVVEASSAESAEETSAEIETQNLASRIDEEQTKIENSNDSSPLKNLPHKDYCSSVELIPMAMMNDGTWADYATYRKENPDKNIFDVTSEQVIVAYVNQREARELLLKSETGVLKDEESNSCIHRLPKPMRRLECHILGGLMLMEALYDSRFESLNYDLEDLETAEDSKLVRDFYDGIIYNMFQCGMTEEQARYYAEHGELPPGSENQSNQKTGQNQSSGQPKKKSAGQSNQGNGSNDQKPKQGSGRRKRGVIYGKSVQGNGSKNSQGNGNIRMGTPNQYFAARNM